VQDSIRRYPKGTSWLSHPRTCRRRDRVKQEGDASSTSPMHMHATTNSSMNEARLPADVPVCSLNNHRTILGIPPGAESRAAGLD